MRPAVSELPRDYRAEWKARQEARAIRDATARVNQAMRKERVVQRFQPVPKQVTNDRKVAMALAKEHAWQDAYSRRRDAEKRLGLLPANDLDAGWQKGRVGTGYHRGAQGVCEADLVRATEDKFDPRAELLAAARKGDRQAVARCDELYVGWRQTGVMRKVDAG